MLSKTSVNDAKQRACMQKYNRNTNVYTKGDIVKIKIV